MPRKKRKNSKFKTNLKYEVYGILIIVLSLISLAGKGEIPGIGPVGRAFSSIFLLLTGEHYYIIPLLLIYIGLYVMIKRKWPLTWSYRKTGLALIIVSILIMYHIVLFEKMDPSGLLFQTSDILMQPYYNLTEYLDGVKDVNAFKLELGGGMIGALFFGLLHFLFDTLGATFVVIALFAIGFMCLTGISYVEMLKRIKPIVKKSKRHLKRMIKQFSRWYKAKRRGLKKNQASSSKRKESEEEGEEPDVVYSDDHVHSEGENPIYGEEPIMTVEEPESNPIMDTYEEDRNSFIPLPPTVEQGNTLTFTKSKPKPEAPYQLPPLHLLEKPNQANRGKQGRNFRANAKKLEDTLVSFGVKAKVIEVVSGPAVTRYEIQPDIGVKVSRIVNLTDDIALALAAKDIRMEAPIPGKAAIGIEVPNTSVSMVTLREVMESSYFTEASSKLTVGLGRDIAGQPIVANLAKMPHLLVAGATGSGKSVCINGLITSILFKAKPDEVKFLMIDPKKVELNVYNGIPHLLAPVVTDPRRASLALKKVVSEMEKRYESFSDSGTRNIEGYNEWLQKKGEEPLPYIVVIVDELADLMMVAANDVEDAITRLAQMARAAGIHLIIATQRPSVNVITGVIKANIPSRIAFGVSSQVDSRTILDGAGAEKLLGRGDMLFMPVGASKPHRIQGAFLSDQEVEAVVQFAKQQEEVKYKEEMVPEVEETSDKEEVVEDELFDQAVQIVMEARQASVSLLQRRMRVGYTRAARLIDSMEAKGIVGPYEGSKPREVLVTPNDVQRHSASS